MKNYVNYFISVILFNLVIGVAITLLTLATGQVVILAFAGIAGFFWGKASNESYGFFKRYMPFLTFAVLMHLYGVVLLIVSGRPLPLNGVIESFLSFVSYLALAVIPVVVCIFYGIGALYAKKKVQLDRFWYVSIVLLIVTGGTMVVLHTINENKLIHETDETEKISEEVRLTDYAPFSPGNKVEKADFLPTITFSDHYPRLDGATAAYPFYSALTETLYKGLDDKSVREYVICSQTDGAYKRLISGETDIVFGVRPSEEQIEAANDANTTFNMTKIGKEAFVFFVNQDSNIYNLSVEQIQKIYTKKIKNWRELGGADEAIVAFQRPANSGSQTIMDNMVMKGLQMSSAPEEEVIQGMGGVLYKTADYRNYSNAIGYSFLYYATVMNPNAGVRLISVNGIEPSAANIKNNSYPFTADIYAVTTRNSDNNENVKKLLDWLASDEGKRLIELCGYTVAE